jgi:TolA-binding protein
MNREKGLQRITMIITLSIIFFVLAYISLPFFIFADGNRTTTTRSSASSSISLHSSTSSSSSLSLEQRIDILLSQHTTDINTAIQMAMDIIIEQQEKIVQLTDEKTQLLQQITTLLQQQEDIYSQCERYVNEQKTILQKIRDFATVQIGLTYEGHDFLPRASLNLHYSYIALEGGLSYSFLMKEFKPYAGLFFRF